MFLRLSGARRWILTKSHSSDGINVVKEGDLAKIHIFAYPDMTVKIHKYCEKYFSVVF